MGLDGAPLPDSMLRCVGLALDKHELVEVRSLVSRSNVRMGGTVARELIRRLRGTCEEDNDEDEHEDEEEEDTEGDGDESDAEHEEGEGDDDGEDGGNGGDDGDDGGGGEGSFEAFGDGNVHLVRARGTPLLFRSKGVAAGGLMLYTSRQAHRPWTQQRTPRTVRDGRGQIVVGASELERQAKAEALRKATGRHQAPHRR
jgi:hypothetical protein